MDGGWPVGAAFVAVKHCRLCGVANADVERVCQNCGSAFKEVADVVCPRSAYRAESLDPTNHQLRTTLRKQYSSAASRALVAAAFLSGITAVLWPLLADRFPGQFSDDVAPTEVRAISHCLMMMFTCAALWARREPLSAAFAAMFIYLAFVTPDIIAHPGITNAGHLGTVITLVMVFYAFSAGLIYRNTSTLRAR